MNLIKSESMPRIMLWPLRNLGCEKDTTGPLMYLGFDVSAEIERGGEVKDVEELFYSSSGRMSR